MMSDPLGTTLFLRFKGGDQQALGTLLDHLRPYIRVIVQGMQGDRTAVAADDSDLIQDAMIQATQAAAKFEGSSVGELVRWLRTIVVRTTYRTLHSSDNVRWTDDEEACQATLLVDPGPSPVEAATRLEQSASMAVAVSRLSDEMQEVLRYRLTDGLEYAVIAKQMGRGSGAVRMLYLRALRKLRDVWSEEFESH